MVSNMLASPAPTKALGEIMALKELLDGRVYDKRLKTLSKAENGAVAAIREANAKLSDIAKREKVMQKREDGFASTTRETEQNLAKREEQVAVGEDILAEAREALKAETVDTSKKLNRQRDALKVQEREADNLMREAATMKVQAEAATVLAAQATDEAGRLKAEYELMIRRIQAATS